MRQTKKNCGRSKSPAFGSKDEKTGNMYSIPEEPAPLNPSVNSPVYELQTERLLLRRVQESDLELFHEILSNHDATTYL